MKRTFPRYLFKSKFDDFFIISDSKSFFNQTKTENSYFFLHICDSCTKIDGFGNLLSEIDGCSRIRSDDITANKNCNTLKNCSNKMKLFWRTFLGQFTLAKTKKFMRFKVYDSYVYFIIVKFLKGVDLPISNFSLSWQKMVPNFPTWLRWC